jgi:ATP-binding cassette, subfamily B, bacterial
MSGMRPMGGGMGMGAYGWRRQDASVAGQKLAKGTLRRIIRFATPFRGHITLFLLLVIVSAFLVIASPLLLSTSSRCRSRSSPGPRPAPWCRG